MDINPWYECETLYTIMVMTPTLGRGPQYNTLLPSQMCSLEMRPALSAGRLPSI